MDTMILTFAALVLIILAMSVGVLLGRKPIKGSCGGMSALGMDTVCDICGGNPSKCDEEQQRSAEGSGSAAELAYEVKSKG
ncbi:(Na+)-NQR maturation NqrM [Marinobacterium sp. AK62]|uniref:(Na+)-NQR maturation NqrM n=1 Tax=Marinobacterium alkalitolerans TaxID=1542925 RepID=A0ABS3ZAD0_9GAMM|nr:(Na+)-NQR maturation NqrM [Marinobacterium alkalitolerans]MBP0048653.1 (Na+)-NQR maturation NqrM [Marinobacterium alkalitolerans]